MLILFIIHAGSLIFDACPRQAHRYRCNPGAAHSFFRQRGIVSGYIGSCP